jgi:iron complex outermembrane receptor protein
MSLSAKVRARVSAALVAMAPACAFAATSATPPSDAPVVVAPPAPHETATADATVASQSATEVADLVVTARHASEKAQEVPIAIAALPAKTLQQTGAYTLSDIQNLVPNLVAYQSNARNSSIGIRGIGVSSAADGLDTTVGVYVDGVYLGRPGMALEDLIDIDQIEVLRGPQGTLFGRNSAAGVVSVTTKAPSFTPDLTVEGSYGDLNDEQVRFSASGPLIDGLLAARLTAFTTHRDGVLPNIETGTSDNSIGRSGARLQFLVTPTPKLSIRVIGDVSTEDDTCCVSVLKSVLPASLSTSTSATLQAFSALGYVPVASTAYTQINSPQDMLTDQHSVSVEADYDLGWAKLTSISAWRHWHFHPLQDSDGTPLDIIQVNVAQTKDDQLTQELRLASDLGRFSWQAGIFLFHQDLKDHYILNQFGFQAGAFYTLYNHFAKGTPLTPGTSIAAGSQYIGDTRALEDSEAAFAQANYKILDNLTLTGGLRYTYEYKHGTTVTSTMGNPYASTSIPFHDNASVGAGNLSYLASLAYKVTPGVMAYVSYSTGYQAAGLNLNAAPVGTNPIVLQPETVADWEAGVKSAFFHDTLVVNVDLFREQLTGLQANITPIGGGKSYLANVGDIRSQGVEGEADWSPIDGLTLSANGSYDDARYTSYPNAPPPAGEPASVVTQNLTGRPVFQAPKWVANAIARYEWDASARIHPYVQAQYTYRSSVYGDVQDSPGSLIPGYSLVNARVGAKFGDRYDASLWIANAFNAVYFQTLGAATITGAGTFGFSGELGAPRTFGATLRAEF